MIGPYHACTTCGAPAMVGDRVCPCGGRIARDRTRYDLETVARLRAAMAESLREARAATFPLARSWWIGQALKAGRTLRALRRRVLGAQP